MLVSGAGTATAPGTGAVVRCDTNPPNPFTQSISAPGGSTNLTVDVLPGAQLVATDTNIQILSGSSTVTNAGSITLTSNGATSRGGINGAGGGNALTNSGSITATGNFARGMEGSGGANILTNSGNISTSGTQGIGITAFGDGNTVTNAGSIQTTGGALSYGIFSTGNSSTIRTSGSITASANGAGGIFVTGGTGNAVENGGTITTSGATSPGVTLSTTAGQAASFVNLATGTVTSQQSQAVLGGAGNERVENHGTLGTGVAGGTSVDLGTGDDTFLIGPTSAITGIVTGGTGTNTFSLGGTGSGTFDLAQLGPTGQYQNFQALTKENSSSWVLTGSTDFAGPTTVNAGTLSVNGSLANSVVTVLGGGTVGGVGTIGGLVVQGGGTAAPGNSVGQLNVSGNVAFQAGSTYQVEVTPSTHDLIVAGGRATLQGGTVQVLASNATYAPSTTYTILTAAQGVTGTFAGVTSNLAFLDPSLSYDANDVFLTLRRAVTASGAPVTFSSVALTFNQRQVAGALDTLALTNPIVRALLSRTADEARRAFNLLSGEIASSTVTAQFQVLSILQQAILGRLVGFGGLGLPGPGLPGFATGSAVEASYAADLPGGRRGETARVPVGGELDPRVFSMWGSGFGSFGSTGTNGNAATLTRDVGGFVLGADATIDGQYRIGLAGGFTRTTFDATGVLSSGESSLGFGAIYGGTKLGPVTIRLGTLFAGASSDTRRTVVFPGFADSLRARFGGMGYLGFAEAGYRVEVTPSVAVEPFVGGAGMRISRDGFTEVGGPAALTVAARDYDIGTFTAGVRGSMAFGPDSPFSVRGTLAYRRAFGDVVPTTLLAFAGGGSQFQTAGIPVDVNALVAEAGIGWQVTPDIALELAYTGQVGARAEDHGVKGSFLWKF